MDVNILISCINQHDTLPIDVKTEVVKALEKQVPKKPICINSTTGYNICPNCGYFELSGTWHCRNCGQALDWGEDDEEL